MMDSDFVGSKIVYSLQILLDYDALNTSKIHSKFILCQKNIISIALSISHLNYCGKKIENFQQLHEVKLLFLTTMGCFT